MMLRNLCPLLLLAALFLAGCQAPSAAGNNGVAPAVHVTVVADGLFGPIGLAALPNGALLVAEEGTGERDDSAGVSLLQPDGTLGRFISGLPSTLDAGDLAGVPLVSLAPDGTTLYVGNFGQGHLWTYNLTAAEQTSGIDLPPQPLTPADLGVALSQLRNVMLANPFDITYDAAGVPVVSDASGNGVATANPDGTVRFFHRFDRLPNPVRASDPIEAVPTGITRVGDEYFVTLTGGCPYPDGGGRLVAIDTQRNQRTIVDGLNMPIDIALGPDGTLWLLEFARFTADADCFSGSGYRTETGRLSRLLPDGTLETVLDHLDFPGAVLPMPDGSLYISQVLPGRILHVTFGAPPAAQREDDLGLTSEPSPDDSSERATVQLSDAELDILLRQVIDAHELTPNPGADQREGETDAAALGQLLFFDPILSGDKNISCATCHHPAFAMADGRVLPIGTGGTGLGPARRFLKTVMLAEEADDVRRLAAAPEDRGDAETPVQNPFTGQFVPRNSPTIINSALLPHQFWDGRVQSYASLRTDATAGAVKTKERSVNELELTDPLAVQALFPITSRHEMAGSTFDGLAPGEIRRRLLARLRAIPDYVALFRQAFWREGEAAADAVTLTRLIDALAAFERRFIFTSSPWDAYLAGDTAALSTDAKRGAALFYAALKPAVNCAQCHGGDLFTDLSFHNLMVPQLGPGKGHGFTGREDWGRAGVTFDARDRYAFRTPSLRNVALTAPYFHDGAFSTLEEAIWHHADITTSVQGYDPSIHGVPPALYSSLQQIDPALHGSSAPPALVEGLNLSESDVTALAAFLRALTDPAATELGHFQPENVPSGLPLDSVSAPDRTVAASTPAAVAATPPPLAGGADDPEPPNSEIRLTDVAAEVGLRFHHGAFQTSIFVDPVAAMGGGLCWIDFDNDGWLDLYAVNSHSEEEIEYWTGRGGLPGNMLFHNLGGRFEDASPGSGADLVLRGNGCVAADFDGDGWTDLFVTADGPNALLWNNGDGTFVEGAAAAGVAAAEWSSAAAVADLNGDGRLDLFVGGYIDLDKKIPKPSGAFPQDYYGIPDRLYLNEGADGSGRTTFREVTQLAGLSRSERTLGALFSDLDLDGDRDLYIANDGHPNRLYASEPWVGTDPADLGFRLSDLTETADVGDSGSGMGIAAGDYDGDGFFDLFVTNWERELNALYRNQLAEEGQLTFQYSTFRIGISGLGNGMTGWGTHLADFDLDTDEDLLIVNGRVPVTNLETDPELVRYYRNRSVDAPGKPGRTGQFLEWTGPVGLKELGPLLGRGSALADFDNDGDLDVALSTVAGPLHLLANTGATGHWLIFDPGAVVPGLRIDVELPDGRLLRREVRAGSSYQAGEDHRLHIGLGPHTAVATVTAYWPDGTVSTMQDVPADQIVPLTR